MTTLTEVETQAELDELIEFSRERIGILNRAESESSLKGGRNPWRHRKAEIRLFLEKLESLREKSEANQ